MNLEKAKARDISKLTSYVYESILALSEAAALQMHCGYVSVTVEYNEMKFFRYKLDIVINGNTKLSLRDRDPELLADRAAQIIWEKMYSDGLSELLSKCTHLKEKKEAVINKLKEYLFFAKTSEYDVKPMRIGDGMLLLVTKNKKFPDNPMHIEILINGTSKFLTLFLRNDDQSEDFANEIWKKMRFLATNELGKNGGYRINGKIFKLQFKQSYPPTDKF